MTVLAISSLPHVTGDIIVFTVPPEIAVPSTTLSCFALGSTLTSVVCTTTDKLTISVVLTFTGGNLNSGTAFSFQLNGIVNPSDTR
jgi:hypothetical protein